MLKPLHIIPGGPPTIGAIEIPAKVGQAIVLKRSLKLFQIDYRGSYLGGTAIVLANSPEEALALVERHPYTEGFRIPEPPAEDFAAWEKWRRSNHEPTTREITGDLCTPRVLYNDNGDY